ncbi:unnamed protein product [Soboliphyme baturini]|uniref:Peptidase S1 domain-containing protein n=1 Tax=Soboliphyme baturini TaxID=241478 RepID=A0A183JB56_9BILA|nr:unnamed protein product [Soboliphyme baturini]
MIRPGSIVMTFGTHLLHAAGNGAFKTFAKSYIFYENALHASGIYGIALIMPKDQIQINELVLPAHLYFKTAAVGMICGMLGWGRFSDRHNSFSERLRFGRADITSKGDCSSPLFYEHMMICLKGQGDYVAPSEERL